MGWFGRKAVRGGGRPFLHAWPPGISGGEEPWPASYEARVRAAYLANPVAQRAVRLVAESVAWAPVYELPTGEARASGADGAAGAMERLARAALLETAATHVLLHGNAFIQPIAGADGRPAELFALRPERVRIEADANGWPAAYLYRVGAATRRIPALDGDGRPGMIHVRGCHPLDDHYGLGCLGAAAGAVAVHNEAARWNAALLANAARPSGALSYAPEDGVPLASAQYERLKAELDAYYAGAGNAGRPLLLEGGLTWQAMSLSPAEMDFAALKASAARDIALAFGVPPMLLGLPGDSTYANYREANRALWRLTVLPLAGKMLDAIGGALAAWWPRRRMAVDVDQVTALAEDRERLWRQVNSAGFLSRREQREMLGFAGEGPDDGTD
jgi:HK97 family phage portal protein